MKLVTVRLMFTALVIFLSSTAMALVQAPDDPAKVQDDRALLTAIQSQRDVNYLQAGHLHVTQILPDDTKGLPHQKWIATTSHGDKVTIVYNSDMGAHVPIKVGDDFGVGGKFLWLGHAGMIHWTHDDPRKNRPDGYVYLNGIIYGDTDHEDN